MTLDLRKDAAIEKTFTQAAENFADVWKTLVPEGLKFVISGSGNLVMLKRTENESQGTQNDEALQNYTGVAIQVSFKSQSDQELRMAQLSGGQKSLVALALIFAIQVCFL
jgi:structural maintenance of chromosome 3 (chondroitin sulfate proteoglycan 6)